MPEQGTPVDAGAGTSAPADAGTQSPAAGAAGGGGGGQEQDVAYWRAKFEDAQASRDKLRAKMREQDASHQQELAKAAEKAQEAGDLAAALKAKDELIASLSGKAQAHDQYAEAFASEVKALQGRLAEVDQDLVKTLPGSATPLEQLSHLRALARVLESQTTKPKGQGPPPVRGGSLPSDAPPALGTPEWKLWAASQPVEVVKEARAAWFRRGR